MKDVIDYLDLVTKEEIIKPIKGLNFLVILDEPDQGLSLVAQRELKNRLNGFIKQKLKTMQLTNPNEIKEVRRDIARINTAISAQNK